MGDDSISVAAAVLAGDFVRRNELDDAEAVRLWRRIRKRMATALARDVGAHLGGVPKASSSAKVATFPTAVEPSLPRGARPRRRAT